MNDSCLSVSKLILLYAITCLSKLYRLWRGLCDLSHRFKSKSEKSEDKQWKKIRKYLNKKEIPKEGYKCLPAGFCDSTF